MNMQWLARVAASAAVRRVVYLAIAALLAWCGIGRAEAAVGSCVQVSTYSYEHCANKGEAWAQADSLVQDFSEYCPPTKPVQYSTRQAGSDSIRTITRGWSCGPVVYQSDFHAFGQAMWDGDACPAESPWNEQTHQCGSGCAGRAPIAGRATRNSLPMCSGGCTFVPDYDSPLPGVPSLQQVALGTYEAASQWKPSGATCDVPNEGEPWDENKSTCYTAPGSNLTECVKPDGSHCVTSGASGRTYCWTDGEEGPKRTADGTEGADRRKAPTPNEPPPTLENPTPGDSSQGNTTINGNTYNTSTYIGTGGTPGQGDTGVPGDGDGDGNADPGSGEGEGEENTSAGGGDCGSPPVSSGDAILSQIAYQTWKTRCAAEGHEQPEWTKGEGPTPGDPEVGDPAQQTAFGIPVSTDLLDQENIFGSASCPSFEIPIPMGDGQMISTNEMPFWCTLLAIMRGVILLWGGYTAIRILQGAVL